ncbi:LLM class flavin-dependent oxidoreductase [Microbispora hainanensis]|jgi:alkanesulfonate monooxygenase SsuD/methylene tetrahydromethanopterin reductase-like flavin-dependent oxidoreductase (luciferase family)|uniref:LLM class flavin-dependent oxidoreductase n=1 Tax=Microbispora TaxID=2005 RepID=UPI0011C9EE7C|nr:MULTISPECIES: LLM class flavin-dependent oxidoreductase [Microbispora]
MEFGILMGDERVEVPPREHLDLLLRVAEAAQRNGFTYLTIGQHFLYDGYRWMQPVPLLSRLSAELDEGVRLGTSIIIGPLYHPIMLAEELATLDILTGGRLVVAVGTGYLPHEYERMGVPFKERYQRLEESLNLLRQLWSQDRVTFSGKFWQIEDAPVHIKPLQQPAPPIWLGAQKEFGVRRAARLGETWTVTPQQTVEQTDALARVFAAERNALGLPLNQLPLRRELMIGADRDDALNRFAAVARGKYEAYADRGMQALSQEQVRARFNATVQDHVILGDAEECRQQIREVAQRLPIGPLLVRPHWPGMSADEAVAWLDEVGREIVEPLREVQPVKFADFLNP